MVGQSEAAVRRASRPGRSGRRPGGSASRDDILQAARKLFAERGYAGATIRAIAADAGVDGALVHHFFISKEKLFAAAISDLLGPAELPPVPEGGSEGLGERLVRSLLTRWEEPTVNQQLQALLRSAVANEEAAGLLRDFLTQELLVRIKQYLPGQDAEVRTALVASQLVGVAFLRYVLAYSPMAQVSADSVVQLLSPTIQSYLSQPLAGLVEVSAGVGRAKPNRSRSRTPRAGGAEAPAKAAKAPAKTTKAPAKTAKAPAKTAKAPVRAAKAAAKTAKAPVKATKAPATPAQAAKTAEQARPAKPAEQAKTAKKAPRK